MTERTPPVLPGIDHIVVLMLENRSFDNVLGWLYDAGNEPPFDRVPNGQTFDGVSGKALTNPGPDGEDVAVGSTGDTTNPYPDPGEEYAQVYGQLYNADPPPPDQVPPEPPQPPPMTGFVNNYHGQKGVTKASNIMNGFRPASLPSLATLAHEYIVCDRWFASVPSQTFTNRSFVNAGTASGHVNNESGGLPFFTNDTLTIFNLLEAQGVSWRIYYGSHWFLCMTFLGQRQVRRYMFDIASPRFHPFQQFLEDAQRGALPSYSFVEPNFMDSAIYGRENDMHPDAAIADVAHHPSDARFGDELVRKVYQALKSGPQWDSTLLIITFDEHGGCYDHVPPGRAVAPDDRHIPPGQDGYSGFQFNRYGVRVPTVLVSPRLPPRTVDHTLYDHTSIIRTVMERFNAQGDLGKRAAAANPLNVTPGELRGDAPDLSVPVVSDDMPLGDSPLTAFQTTIARGAALHLMELAPGGDKIKEPSLTTKLQTETELQLLAALLPMLKSL